MPNLIGSVGVGLDILPADPADPYLYVYRNPNFTFWFCDRSTQGAEFKVETPPRLRSSGGVPSATFRLVGAPTGLIPVVTGNLLTVSNVSIQMLELSDHRIEAKYTLNLTTKPTSNVVQWTVTLDHGAGLILNADKTVSITNDVGEVVFTQPAPTAIDNASLGVIVTPSWVSPTLTYTLANINANRYPVVVDPTTIGTQTGSALTGGASQGHLFFAVNQQQWVYFYIDTTTTNVVKCLVSSNDALSTATWSAPTNPNSPTLATAHNGDSRNLSLGYKNIGSTDVVYIGVKRASSGSSTDVLDYIRCTISGPSTVTWGTWANLITCSAANTFNSSVPSNTMASFSTDNKIYFAHNTESGSGSAQGDAHINRSITADTGSSGVVPSTHDVVDSTMTNFCNRGAVFPLASGNMLYMYDDGNGTEPNCTNIKYSKFTTSWSAGANSFSANATIDQGDWGASSLSTTSVMLVRKNTTTLFESRVFDGTSWGTLASLPTLPAAHLSGSGIFVSHNTVNYSCFYIATDASNTIYSCDYNAGSNTWGAWSSFVSTSATRTFLSGAINPGGATGVHIGVIWTEGSSVVVARSGGDIFSGDGTGAALGSLSSFGEKGTTQFSFPIADVTDGNWTNEVGSNVNLFASIDETTPNDADYIKSEAAPNADVSVVKLGSMTDPGVNWGHRVHYRYFNKTTATTKQTSLLVELLQGTTTVITSWNHILTQGQTVLQADQILADADAASITDYTNLHLRFTATY